MTSQRARDRLATSLKEGGIEDARVIDVIRNTPRHHFIDQALHSRAYENTALPIGHGQTISQPWVVARMTEALLEFGTPQKVLEIGTGSGYQAAILAALGADVTSLERHDVLAAQAAARIADLELPGRVTIRTTDGSLGDAEGAPWDGIIVTAAAPSIPNELRGQLADRGRLVIPVGPRDHQVLTLVVRHGDDWRETPHGAVVFVPLIGEGGFPEERGRRDEGWRRWF
jgi:protein-L-isoaspartate(D-aspartate) O-methyltransferase